jgi:oxaloacetate decarboxylase gamma subunit
MNELISVAIELMLLGMGTVFVFLVLLIGSTSLMSSVLMRTASEKLPEAKLVHAPVMVNSSPVQDPRLLKAIGEAIRQHRGQV